MSLRKGGTIKNKKGHRLVDIAAASLAGIVTPHITLSFDESTSDNQVISNSSPAYIDMTSSQPSVTGLQESDPSSMLNNIMNPEDLQKGYIEDTAMEWDSDETTKTEGPGCDIMGAANAIWALLCFGMCAGVEAGMTELILRHAVPILESDHNDGIDCSLLTVKYCVHFALTWRAIGRMFATIAAVLIASIAVYASGSHGGSVGLNIFIFMSIVGLMTAMVWNAWKCMSRKGQALYTRLRHTDDKEFYESQDKLIKKIKQNEKENPKDIAIIQKWTNHSVHRKRALYADPMCQLVFFDQFDLEPMKDHETVEQAGRVVLDENLHEVVDEVNNKKTPISELGLQVRNVNNIGYLDQSWTIQGVFQLFEDKGVPFDNVGDQHFHSVYLMKKDNEIMLLKPNLSRSGSGKKDSDDYEQVSVRQNHHGKFWFYVETPSNHIMVRIPDKYQQFCEWRKNKTSDWDKVSKYDGLGHHAVPSFTYEDNVLRITKWTERTFQSSDRPLKTTKSHVKLFTQDSGN